jgi:hypothetical protein
MGELRFESAAIGAGLDRLTELLGADHAGAIAAGGLHALMAECQSS